MDQKYFNSFNLEYPTHVFFSCKIFDRESRKKETVGKEDDSRNSEAIEKQIGMVMGGCWVICVCVCVWVEWWHSRFKEKKRKETKRLSKSEFVYYCCCFCYNCKYSCGGVESLYLLCYVLLASFLTIVSSTLIFFASFKIWERLRNTREQVILLILLNVSEIYKKWRKIL